MSRTLAVFLNEEHLADLNLDARGLMELRYLPTAQKAISLSLPVRTAPYTNKEVVPFVLGLLPDNEWILKSWARQYGTSTHPFLLLSNVGHDCAGAIQFVKPSDTLHPIPDSLVFLEDDTIEEELATSRHAFNGLTTNVINGRFSLAGAQPKITLFQHGTTIARPLGRWPTTHIYKPTSSLEGQAENEYFCLHLASQLDLPTASTDILSFGSETALVSRRYDRFCLNQNAPLERASWSRLHQEDMCQALGVPPSRKYQNQGGPTPAQIGQLLDRVSSDPLNDKQRFAAALFYNWLVAGTDGHAKNFSLLHLPEGGYRLSPLYDVVSARPYALIFKPDVALSMKIGDTYKRNEITTRSWVSLWKSLGLDPQDQKERAMTMLDQLPLAMNETCRHLHESGVTHAIVNRLATAIKSDLAFFKNRMSEPVVKMGGP